MTPYDSVLNVAKGRYAIFPVGALLKHPFDSTVYVEQIDVPSLIIKAETDWVIPHQYTDNLITLWKSPLTQAILPGTHGNVIDSDEYVIAVKEFIRSLGYSTSE